MKADRRLEPRFFNRSWSWILRAIIMPMGDLTFGHPMMRRLAFLEQAQWWSREQLHEYRDRALRSLLSISYEQVPFYRALMDRVGARPEDVRGAQDLPRLPVVTKRMMRKSYPAGTTRNTGFRTYEASSSGSTGTNFYVKEDTETAGWYRASFMLALQWAGWKIGEPHLQTGMTPARSVDKRLKDMLLRCRYVSAFHLDDLSLDRTLDILEQTRTRHLWGYPGSLYALARRAAQTGWAIPLHSVVTWGDMLYPRYRLQIEHSFRTRVFDTYGCGEGIQIAAQCGHLNNYHVHTPDVIVEYLDDRGSPVEPGSAGNIVLTRLHPGPMPLIRYKVGDVAVSGGKSCECGRGYDLMESIQGRDTDIITTPSGKRLIVHFFTGVLEHFPEIESFQVVQEARDAILLRIVPAASFSKECASRVISNLKARGASDIAIDLELVKEIPLTLAGKRRFVINRLDL